MTNSFWFGRLGNLDISLAVLGHRDPERFSWVQQSMVDNVSRRIVLSHGRRSELLTTPIHSI